jgi:antitoxin component of MazEF toxin-antitoxin module
VAWTQIFLELDVCWRYDTHMVAHVEKTANGFMISVPTNVAEAWNLSDGSAVELTQICRPVADERTIRYATVEEALAAFRDTLPQHEEAYRELAK